MTLMTAFTLLLLRWHISYLIFYFFFFRYFLFILLCCFYIISLFSLFIYILYIISFIRFHAIYYFHYFYYLRWHYIIRHDIIFTLFTAFAMTYHFRRRLWYIPAAALLMLLLIFFSGVDISGYESVHTSWYMHKVRDIQLRCCQDALFFARWHYMPCVYRMQV